MEPAKCFFFLSQHVTQMSMKVQKLHPKDKNEDLVNKHETIDANENYIYLHLILVYLNWALILIEINHNHIIKLCVSILIQYSSEISFFFHVRIMLNNLNLLIKHLSLRFHNIFYSVTFQSIVVFFQNSKFFTKPQKNIRKPQIFFQKPQIFFQKPQIFFENPKFFF